MEVVGQRAPARSGHIHAQWVALHTSVYVSEHITPTELWAHPTAHGALCPTSGTPPPLGFAGSWGSPRTS